MGFENRENGDYHPSERITATTQILGVIGSPVSHAMSPLMHNKAIQHLKLDYIYVGFSVIPSNLAHAIQGIKALNISGLSITIPHKVTIMQYLDEVDPLAKQIGAVNTVKNVEGKLYGRNTDGKGCLKGITDAGVKLHGKNVVILGAGGAARAIGMYLAGEVESLTIINRTASRLQELVTRLKSHSDIPITGNIMKNGEEISQVISNADILINATSVGMYPHIQNSPIDASWLHADLFVHDIIYTPFQTQLLRDASKIGCQTLSGVDMLVNQGILAFEWWTGAIPNQKVMKEAVIQQLTKKKLKICVSLPLTPGMAMNNQILKAKQAGAKYIEVRLDYISDEELQSWTLSNFSNLVTKSPLPIILTYLKNPPHPIESVIWEKILIMCIQARPAFVDIPIFLPRSQKERFYTLASENNVSIIYSYHDFSSTPLQNEAPLLLNRIIQACPGLHPIDKPSENPLTILKLIFMATSLTDNDVPFQIAQILNQKHIGFISFCMGIKGIKSRVLSLQHGAFLSFAALTQSTAPGQISIEEFIDYNQNNTPTQAER